MKPVNACSLVVFVVLVVWVFRWPSQKVYAFQSHVLGWFEPVLLLGSEVSHQAELVKSEDAGVDGEEKEMLANDSAAGAVEDRVFRERSVERLKEELSILEQEYANLKNENDRFRDLLEFKQRADFDLVSAEVVGRTAANWWSSLVINKGMLDGVGTDSPVLTSDGLVGKTAQVSKHSAVVLLLTDERCRVSARVQGTPEQGILMGQRGDFEKQPMLSLKFLSKEGEGLVGGELYTSGAGGLFPSGMRLGQIHQYRANEVYGEAVVSPAVDFINLREVFIMQKVEADKAETKEPEVRSAVPAS